MSIIGVTYGKLKTSLKVNGNLKLFLFPDIFKQWISCPERYM